MKEIIKLLKYLHLSNSVTKTFYSWHRTRKLIRDVLMV